MQTDPRVSDDATRFYRVIKDMEPDQLVRELQRKKDDDLIGWAKYQFMQSDSSDWKKPWQVIVINRWLERDKFFRNILPQWLGTGFGLLSFVVSVVALVVALNPPKP